MWRITDMFRWRQFAGIVVTVSMMLLLIELLMRGYCCFRLKSMPSFWYVFPAGVAEYDEVLGYRLKKGYTNQVGEKINSRGFRGNDFENQPTGGRKRIVAMGGSTTYGVGVSNEETYPGFMETIAEANAFPIEVINAGVSGYHSYHHGLRLPEILSLNPEMLILYTGWNDFGVALMQGHAYQTNTVQGSGTLVLPQKEGLGIQGLRVISNYSICAHQLKQIVTKIRWQKKYQRIVSISEDVKAVNTADKDKGWVPDYDRIAKNYRQNLENMIKTAQVRGVRVVLVTMPFVLRTTSYAEDDQHLIKAYPNLESNAYRKYYAKWHRKMISVQHDLAIQHGLIIVEASEQFDHIPWVERISLFSDHIHLTAQGNKLLAKFIVEGIEKSI